MVKYSQTKPSTLNAEGFHLYKILLKLAGLLGLGGNLKSDEKCKADEKRKDDEKIKVMIIFH